MDINIMTKDDLLLNKIDAYKNRVEACQRGQKEIPNFENFMSSVEKWQLRCDVCNRVSDRLIEYVPEHENYENTITKLCKECLKVGLALLENK